MSKSSRREKLDSFVHIHRRWFPQWFVKKVCNSWDSVNGLYDDLNDDGIAPVPGMTSYEEILAKIEESRKHPERMIPLDLDDWPEE